MAPDTDPDEPDPDIKKERGPEPKIDSGKVLALHKAGWDYEKTGDELNLNVSQVRSAIYRAKKKEEKKTQ